MTRIVAGRARGRRLGVPSTGTRPTSDRAREAVFSSLESIRGPFAGTAVLDLYAGSGALGLEAASRGALRVDLVESDRRAARVIEDNVSTVVDGSLDPRPVVTVHSSSVHRWLTRASGAAGSGVAVAYDVVFCDPPYSMPGPDVAEVIASLRTAGMLADGGLVVVERAHRAADWQWPAGFGALRDSAYGEAHLWIAAVEAGGPPSDSVAPC